MQPPKPIYKEAEYPATLVFVDRHDLDDQRLDEEHDIKLFVDSISKQPEPPLSLLQLLMSSIATQVGHTDPRSFADNLFEAGSPNRTAIIQLLIKSLKVGFARVRRLSSDLPLYHSDRVLLMMY